MILHKTFVAGKSAQSTEIRVTCNNSIELSARTKEDNNSAGVVEQRATS